MVIVTRVIYSSTTSNLRIQNGKLLKLGNSFMVNRHESIRGVLACASASTFFFFTILQLTLFNSIGGNLIKHYSISSGELGLLSSSYLIANAIWLIPGGSILDYFRIKKVAVIFLSLCVISSFLFLFSDSILEGAALRFIQGLGSAMSLLVSIRVAVKWFPKRSAAVIGLMVSFGMMGGIFSNMVFPWVTRLYGWQNAMLYSSFIGLLFLFGMIFFLNIPEKQEKEIDKTPKMKNILALIKDKQIIKAGLYIGFMNAPIFVIATLWGSMYLQQARLMSISQASLVTSLIFLGEIIGSPISGWFSDKIASRRIPMAIGSVCSLILVIPLIYVNNLSFLQIALMFFIIGFLIGVQIVAYPLVVESAPKSIGSTATGVASFISNLIGAISQPIFGYLMSCHLSFFSRHGFAPESVSSYKIAMLILPIGFLVSFILCFLIKETADNQFFSKDSL